MTDWEKYIKTAPEQQVLLALKGIYAVIDERLAQTNALLAAILDATNLTKAESENGKEAKHTKKRK